MKYKIKELGNVITGSTPSTKNKQYYNSQDYMFITPPDMNNNRFIKKTNKYISNLALKDNYSKILKQDDILISCIGTIGYVSIVTSKCMSNQQINTISEINKTIVLPMFLYYKLLYLKKYFDLIGNNGAVMPIINKSMFENIEIDLPSLPTQQHIVDTIN